MTDSANSTDSTVTDAPERRPADTQPPADYPADLAWPPRFTFTLLEWDVYLGASGLAEIESNGGNIGDTMGLPHVRGVFDSEAAAWAAYEDWLISYSPTRAEDRAWHRESYPPHVFPVKWRWLQRQIANENPLVWRAESWWQGNADIWRDHFTSVSTTDSTLLAYVQTPQKGQKGIRTPVKPGRYLTKFFGSILTEKQIAFYAAWQSTGAKPNGFDSAAYQLRFAHTPKEIEEVYISGPVSCMSDDADEFNGVHPCRVYGAGDLAVAWLEWSADDGDSRAGRPMARALCWPAKKVFGRVYPNPESWNRDGFRDYAESEDAQRALAARLMSEGYQDIQCVSGGFDGARLLKIECDSGADRYVMPYLDRGYSVGDNGGRYFYMCRQSRAYESVYEGTSTDGYIVCGPAYDAHCERCDEGCFSDNTSVVVVSFRNGRPRNTQVWCDSCVENYTFTCAGCDETVDSDIDSAEVNGCYYAEPWLLENASYSERFETWIMEDESTVQVLTEDGTERWPEDAFNTELKAGAVFACPIAAAADADSEDIYCMTDAGVTCAVTGRLLHPESTHLANGFRVGVDVTADMVTELLRVDAVLHAAPEVPAAVIWPAECQMRLPLPPAVFGHDTAYAAGFSIAAD